MYEANTTDFKPAEGEMPNTIERFNLESVKGTIKAYSDSPKHNLDLGLIVIVFVVFFGGGILVLSTNADRKKHEKELEAKTKHVNQAVTTLEKSDIEDVNAVIDSNLLATIGAGRGSSQGGYKHVMSEEEKLMKKLVPDVPIFDPDAK